ncbi:MAG: hypothetical protein U0572_03245 [Phycisphaerales bacterium]
MSDAAPPASAAARTCSDCGYALVGDATRCTECGLDVAENGRRIALATSVDGLSVGEACLALWGVAAGFVGAVVLQFAAAMGGSAGGRSDAVTLLLGACALPIVFCGLRLTAVKRFPVGNRPGRASVIAVVATLSLLLVAMPALSAAIVSMWGLWSVPWQFVALGTVLCLSCAAIVVMADLIDRWRAELLGIRAPRWRRALRVASLALSGFVLTILACMVVVPDLLMTLEIAGAGSAFGVLWLANPALALVCGLVAAWSMGRLMRRWRGAAVGTHQAERAVEQIEDRRLRSGARILAIAVLLSIVATAMPLREFGREAPAALRVVSACTALLGCVMMNRGRTGQPTGIERVVRAIVFVWATWPLALAGAQWIAIVGFDALRTRIESSSLRSDALAIIDSLGFIAAPLWLLLVAARRIGPWQRWWIGMAAIWNATFAIDSLLKAINAPARIAQEYFLREKTEAQVIGPLLVVGIAACAVGVAWRRRPLALGAEPPSRSAGGVYVAFTVALAAFAIVPWIMRTLELSSDVASLVLGVVVAMTTWFAARRWPIAGLLGALVVIEIVTALASVVLYGVGDPWTQRASVASTTWATAFDDGDALRPLLYSLNHAAVVAMSLLVVIDLSGLARDGRRTALALLFLSGLIVADVIVTQWSRGSPEGLVASWLGVELLGPLGAAAPFVWLAAIVIPLARRREEPDVVAA